jgi:ubiquinone/menaquinone biosynthesis C-methylase UbiE
MSNGFSASETATGRLFGDLFAAYDDAAFKRSVELFSDRFIDAGFDVSWFKGKKCLDAGCGGGRYSIAMAHLGASEVMGVDLSEVAVQDARRRAEQLGADHVTFKVGSVAALPADDASFDCVIHSGVLMHTAEPVKVLRELNRVLRPGGMLYALVYATEGLRWPLVQMLRPIAQHFEFETLDRAVDEAGMPVNRRRTYLDDLFVPFIDFYSWPCLKGLLEHIGFESVSRWEKGRLDHEQDLDRYVADLRGFLEVFGALSKMATVSGLHNPELARTGTQICLDTVNHAESILKLVRCGALTNELGRALVIGQGHHRLIATKKLS